MTQAKTEKRVVLLGGSGFIGTALARSLVSDGYAVTIMSRSPERVLTKWRTYGLHFPTAAPWSGRPDDSLDEQVDGSFAVINLVGESIEARWTGDRKARILNSRLRAGEAVMHAVSRAAKPPEVLIQGSAVGYYGHAGGDAVMTEQDEPGTGFLAEVCQAWEASTAEARQFGVRRAVVRTGIVIGPNGGVMSRLEPLFKAFLGGPPGGGRFGFPWVALADEVGAIRFLMETQGLEGPYNVVAPEAVSMRAFCRELGKVLRRPWFMPVPAFALRVFLGEMAEELLLSGQYVSSSRLEKAGYVFRFPLLRPALTHFLTGLRKL